MSDRTNLESVSIETSTSSTSGSVPNSNLNNDAELQTNKSCENGVNNSETKLEKGLRMLEEASDENLTLLALKELRYFVSEPASTLIKSTSLFSIDVDESCTEFTDLLQIVIDSDTHTKIVHVLKPYLCKQTSGLSKTEISIMIEGLWVITNIASGKSAQTQTITETDILPLVIDLALRDVNFELVIQCIMLISNVIADDATSYLVQINDRLFRRAFQLLDKIRLRQGEGCLDSKCSMCKTAIESEVHILHLFTSIFKAKRSVPDSKFERILLTCCSMLSDGINEVLHEVLEVLFKASDGFPNFIQIIINYSYVPEIVKLIAHDCKVVRNKAIYIVGNLMLGSDDLTWRILKSSLFVHFPRLLYSKKETVSQVLWILSNIVAGPSQMLECLFDFDLWPYVGYCLNSSGGTVIYESLWVVANFMDNATQEQTSKVLCFDKYGIVAAIIPYVSIDVVYLTRKDVASQRNLDLVMECFGMILSFVEKVLGDENENKNLKLKKGHQLYEIVELLKSEKLKANFAKIIEEKPFDSKVMNNDERLSDILISLL